MPKTLRFLIPLIVLFLSACSLAEDVAPPEGSQQQPVVQSSSIKVSGPVYPIVPPDPAQGAEAFAEKCASCHGDRGLGNGPLSSRSAVPVAAIGTSEIARAGIPAEWYILISEGDLERGMPPFTSLTDRQKWDVIAYVYQLSMDSAALTLGEGVYAANCASCHGDTGHGDGPAGSALAVPPTDFTDQEVMAALSDEMIYQSISTGVAGLMPGFAQLGEDERWALTDYVRTLSFAHGAGETVDEAPIASAPTPETAEASPEPTQETDAAAVPGTPAASRGRIVVELVNGSGGEVPGGTPVTLYGVDNMQEIFSTTLTTGHSGVYLFTGVEMLPGRSFFAGVEYAGGTYGSDIVVAEEGVSELKLQVIIYDTSTDISQLILDRAHIILDFSQEEVVQVIEMFIISNPTDYAIVSPEAGGAVVSFQLPADAVGLWFQYGELGERYIEIPGGFADTVTIQPGMGQYQVVFAYRLLYDGKLDFSQPMTMDTNAVVVMLPDVGVKVKGEGFADDGVRDMQGTLYSVYSAGGLKAGTPLEFSLSGKVKTGSEVVTTTSSSGTIAIGLGVFGLALVGAGVWLYARNRKQEKAELVMEQAEAERIAAGPEREDPNTVIDAIIALDDQYKAGKIPEEAYMTRRDELKARLERATSTQE